MRRAILSVITLITTVAFAGTAIAGHHLASEQPTVGNLKWMTGSWAGDIGGPTLEENWTQAKAGSIASLVRITSPEGTAMVEIVNIQEMEGTLVLHIQQWDPGFVPRADAQKMVLESIGHQSVNFNAASPGGLKKLGYSLTEDGQFLVQVTTAEDQEMTLPLSAMQR